MHKARRQDQSRIADFLVHPRRALWRLSLPILGGMAIHTLYSVVDMMFVGWVGPDAVTALAFNMPLVFMAFGISMGLSTGVTAVVAQAIGARDKARADNTAEHAMVLGLILGLAVSAAGLLWGPWLLGLLGAVGDINTLAWSYFQIICWGLLFSVLSSFFRGILAGEGDTLRPMMIMGLGMVFNIILDPIFIFGLGQGVRGAALATVASQVVVCAIFIYLVFLRRSTYVTFKLRHFRFRAVIMTAIFRIGIPASLSFVFMSLGQAAYNRILSSYSHYAVAAYQIAGRVEMIYFMPIIAIAAGLVTLVGMFFGAGEFGKLRGIIHYALGRCIIIGLAAIILIYPLAPTIMKIFRPSEEILTYGITYLRIIVIIFPFAPIGMISGRVMQGMGKGLPFMVISFLRVLAVGAPLAAGFTYILHKPIEWVWFAMISGGAVSMVVGVLWLRSALRRVESLPRKEVEPLQAPEAAVERVG